MKLMTRGNHKLPTSTLNFSLPPVTTCPGSTAECRKFCYAKKAFRQYKNVRTAWIRNLEESKKDSFIKTISDQIKNSRTVKTIRIHTSGDLYSEEYYNKWIQIAKAFPKLTFYAYTKVVTMGKIKRPKNFILLLSDDHKIFKNYWKFFDGIATVTRRGDTPDKGFFVCPGSCRSCHYCYDDTKNKKVTFEEH